MISTQIGLMIALIIIAILVAFVTYYGITQRCPKCGKRTLPHYKRINSRTYYCCKYCNEVWDMGCVD